jgi:hypothetical protein
MYGYVHEVGQTEPDRVIWDPLLPVYTDGSVHNGTGLLGQAGWAALQMTPDGQVARQLEGRLPQWMPQSADFAEHYAVWVVAQRAHEPVEIVTDCNGVRASYEAGKAAEGPDRPHAGLWRTIRRDKLAAIHKVKAHLSRDEAERRGMGHWWQGNFLVDLAAKRAAARLAPPVAEVTEYHRQLPRAT